MCKRKLKGDEWIGMWRNVSALLGRFFPQIPKKCKDLGTFCVACIIANNKFENSMLDLGASINGMPLSIFNSFSPRPLQPTGVVIQCHAKFLLIFIFFIWNMDSALIILGRQFLKTTQTKINVHVGTLSMEFYDICKTLGEYYFIKQILYKIYNSNSA